MHNNTKKMVLLSLFIAVAMSLSYFERFIPLPWNVPGMKLGLANIVTLFVLYYYSGKEAFTVVILRVVLVSIIVGSGMSFFYSLAGGIFSFFSMKLLMTYFRKSVSLIGISIAGAVSHNIGQLIVLAIITSRVTIALSYSPVLIISGVATGIFVGISANYFITHLSVHIKP